MSWNRWLKSRVDRIDPRPDNTAGEQWQFASASTASAASAASASAPPRQLGVTDLDFVAVNDLTDTKTLAHLLKYDSVHGRYPGEVSAGEGLASSVDGDAIKVLSEKDPAKLPGRTWGWTWCSSPPAVSPTATRPRCT